MTYTRAIGWVALLVVLAGCATDPVAPSPVVGQGPVMMNPLPAGDDQVPTLDISRVDMAPVARRQVRPRYPVAMRRAGLAGEALVDFVVDENGVTRNVFPRAATAPDFGVAAVESVAQWKFSPGRKDGKPVRTHMQVPIVFTLNEDK